MKMLHTCMSQPVVNDELFHNSQELIWIIKMKKLRGLFKKGYTHYEFLDILKIPSTLLRILKSRIYNKPFVFLLPSNLNSNCSFTIFWIIVSPSLLRVVCLKENRDIVILHFIIHTMKCIHLKAIWFIFSENFGFANILCHHHRLALLFKYIQNI